MTDPLLSLRGIGKKFPGVIALDRVDFTVRAGEIHALLGENGAGKSTLIKVLTGVYEADAGEIRLGGTAIRPRSPAEAERFGLSTVYQEVNLIPSLSVAENLCLGRQPGRFGFIHWRAVRQHARAALARLGLELDVDAELGSLSVALQQMVAIARALDRQAKLLILDEPTASLDEKEVADLFAIMRQLRGEGLGLVFVTHFLDQVYAVTDRITVLRNGALVGEFATATLPRLELIGKMLGRKITPATHSSAGPQLAEAASDGSQTLEGPALRSTSSGPRASRGASGPGTSSDDHGRHRGRPSTNPSGDAAASISSGPILEARGLARKGAIHPLDLALHSGETLGLAGLLGSGRTETARLLFGIDRRDAGKISYRGKPVSMGSPQEAIRLGLAFCSEDRKAEGILPNLSVRENLIIALQGRRGAGRALTSAEQQQLCTHYVEALRIKTADTEVPIRTLSGGNQQKVLLARWLATQPALIILDEPTRGIDIGARAEIEALIAKLRADGIAVLLISSELEEIVSLSTRVAVLRERHAVGEFRGADISIPRLMQAMAGGHQSHE